MSDKTYTIAVLQAKSGKIDALIGLLENLATETRKEAGCVEYGFYQNQADPQVVLSYEAWRDVDAETAHWKTPHLTHAIEAFKDILDGQPTVYKGPKII